MSLLTFLQLSQLAPVFALWNVTQIRTANIPLMIVRSNCKVCQACYSVCLVVCLALTSKQAAIRWPALMVFMGDFNRPNILLFAGFYMGLKPANY